MTLLIDPRVAPELASAGLTTFEELFERTPGPVVSGHPSRNVARFHQGAWHGYLKREHWTPWKDYLASWWAGFGLASKSLREWRTLLALHQAGIGCPEPLAVGQHRGRAFLLVRHLDEAVDLGTYLQGPWLAAPAARRRFARALGAALARLHRAGFTHPDLYAKHVFINLRDGRIQLIDFQRTRRRRTVAWSARCRDLAALDASLGDHLVVPRERLACLHAYLDAAGANRRVRRACLVRIRARTRHLLGRRKLQAMRQRPSDTAPAVRVEHHRVAVLSAGRDSSADTQPAYVGKEAR